MTLHRPEKRSKTYDGKVLERLRAAGADDAILAGWQDIVRTDIEAEADEDEFS